MMNRAINHLVLATVDSLKKFKNKLAYYLAIFAMVFGSTFGTFNAANAVTLTIAENETFNIANGTDSTSPTRDNITGVLTANFNAITGAATLLIDGTASQMDATAIVIGTLTDTGDGVMGVNVVHQATNDFNSTISFASVNIDGSLDVEADDEAGVSSKQKNLTILADSSVGTTMFIDNNDATDGLDMVVDMNGDLVVGAMANGTSGGGALTITAVGNLTGPVVSSTTLKVSGDLTAKGAAGLGVDAIVLDDLTAGTTGGAILQLDGGVAQAVSGEIDGGGAKEGDIIVTGTGTSVTFSDKIGVGAQIRNIQVAANAEAIFGDIVDATTLNIDNDVTFSENANVVGVGNAGALDFAAASIITIDDTIAAGEVVLDVTATLASTSGTVIVTSLFVNLPSNFTTGTITFLDDNTAQSVTDAELLLINETDTALTDFTVAHANSKQDVIITAAAKTEAATATALGVTAEVSRSLKQANAAIKAAGNAAGVDAFTNALNVVNGMTAATDTDLALQVAPQTDTISGSAVATRAMTGTVQGIVSNRMASLRSGDAFVTGMSAGNGMSANSGFIQAFGSEAEQKNAGTTTAKVYGYDSQTSGVAIGFDGMTETGETIGLSASYSSTDVDGKGTGKSKNAIDSYTVSVYADKATENGYIEGSLTYGINDNTSSRLVNTAGLSRTYKGDYDSEQISLKVGGGVPNEVKDGTFVTPFASATGTLITTDSYTETSTTASDALRLKIAQDDINSLVGTIGVKAHMITDKGTPMISFAINNEFGDTTINSTNTYTGGGTAFNTSTDVEELSATLGLGYSFGNDVSSVNIGYEANANEDDYLSHYGTVKIISKF